MEEKKLNLFEKIQLVSDDIGAIEKNLTVGTGKNSYKAVADFDVIVKVKEMEKKHGIISMAIKQEVVSSETIQYVDDYKHNKIKFVDNIKMTTRIYDLEDPTKFIDVESNAKGIDGSDKGLGKASTYARKYALLNAYKIPTGEDLDDKKSDEITPVIVDTKRDSVVNYLMQNQESKERMLQHFNLASLDDFSSAQIEVVYNQAKKEGRL